MSKIFRNVCFTINNPTDVDVDGLKELDWKYLIYQSELGEDGTEHLQGYMEFEGQKRFQYLKTRIPRAHIEARRGTQQQAIDYCRKEETRLDGPFEYGEKKMQGKRNEWHEAIEAVKDGASERELAMEFTATYIRYHKGLNRVRMFVEAERDKPVDVLWLWGPTGCGKTRYVYDNYEAVYNKPEGPWFDGYDGDEVALFDDFEAVDIGITQLLKLLDRYPMKVPVKGGFVNWNPKTIVITSNYEPKVWYQRRYRGGKHWAALNRRISGVLSDACFRSEGNTSLTSKDTPGLLGDGEGESKE